ncbi:MAG: 2-C-methyl-D-erythritol 2,4-cyclodiphosphate synthase [Eubacterium sp.]|nr:2-C-methyl-D-erythritol 2,4-cyclodiphosphate synthase [Eubacterium sp.]
MRIGQGYDVHRLVEGRKLILGGIEISHTLGLLGHSDADVLSHAITDAILGAAAMGDIGLHFPDTDDRWKGADSIELMKTAYAKVLDKGFEVENIDATVMAEKPKLRPYIDDIRANIAEALGIDLDRVSIKATTEEGLGFTGREEGIAAMAVVLLK